MKDFISKPANFSKLEFWGATTFFVFAVFFLISDALNIGLNNTGNNGITKSPFDYYFVNNLIRYTVLYGAFLILNFRIVPDFIKKEAIWVNIILTIILFLLIGLIFGASTTFLKYAMMPQAKNDRVTHNFLFQKGFLLALWLLLLYGFYSVIKYTGLYLLTRTEDLQTRFKIITPGGLALFVLWVISMFFMIIGGAPEPVISVWLTFIPHAIFLYWYSFHSLIPKALTKNKRQFISYLVKVFFVLVVTAIPVIAIAGLVANDGDTGLVVAIFNAFFQLLITAPVSWVLYKRYLQSNDEIHTLKKELGQSNANFDFLRSQINPHFLFNALNTIYGTALQEGAERTSDGIEKLGDMMRFMLQENMQEKISLTREIDYLTNYIALQKLRTDPNPNVRIDVQVEQPLYTPQIAPMLLIPFVENAFKHGISFREPSHIKVTLEMKDKTLYFDVYNSKHVRAESDPEKEKSGIGLNNVRQRLRLLYPNRHELIIRETGKDFFVHLTIQLT